jgi:hypothetical protein
MSNKRPENIIRRLVTIKYLYLIGVEQSKQAGTFAGFSILALHDCVEMLLVLIAEKKNKKSQQHFLDYWGVIQHLPYKVQMENLNSIRKNLKHHANFPDKADIQRCCEDVDAFLKETTKKFLKIEFEDISLSTLISFEAVKEDIEKAETFMKGGFFYESLDSCKKAFMKLLSSYESNKGQWRNSILNVGGKIGSEYRQLVKSNREGINWFEQITKTTNSVRDVMKITALGIDYKRYALFNFITPNVIEGCDATGTIYVSDKKDSFESKISIKKEDCQFCISFVVDCALKLQEFDFDLNNYLKG